MLLPERFGGYEPLLRVGFGGMAEVLGVVAWELLTVRPVFRADSAAEAFEAATEDAIPALSASRGDVPAGVEAVVRRALRRDRDERFDTARELAGALRRAAHEAGLEPSETRVAAFLEELAPAPLRALTERLRQLAPGSRPDDIGRSGAAHCTTVPIEEP